MPTQKIIQMKIDITCEYDLPAIRIKAFVVKLASHESQSGSIKKLSLISIKNKNEIAKSFYNPVNLTMTLLFFGDNFRSRNAKNIHDTSFES